jgi:antitoxin (DNA-binding transcriptional repressor) of toxin-antitoxin stability system
MAVFIANLGFMTMQILTSREVQKNFGAISDKVVREGETMTITKYGRPSLYILPANEETATLVRRMAGRRLIQKMKSRAPNAEAEKLTQADINQLIDECFR